LHNGTDFSTFDHDADQYSGSCADEYKGGWWYTKCYNSDLNGKLMRQGTGIVYNSFIESVSLKGSKMMMRSRVPRWTDHRKKGEKKQASTKDTTI
jgi:hypothetical protein